ncbi:hypothetical protein AGOR_G00000220 [Albula goreensis]|uniref:A-kinase-interacting protein 1 n=1 Tax=Albula goreensis TaxID=1534307 RepID=A0A8T3E9Y3_9TELE|nr:hypothetical protein AGOR_G00000220 [Albula goreensis]
MSSRTWMDSSLRRSSRLGLQVLERAQRRSVDWASRSPSPQPTHAEETLRIPNSTRNRIPTWEAQAQKAKPHTTLDDAFETIVEFMGQTTQQCKNFYRCVPVQNPSQAEVKHVCRYHPHQLQGELQRIASEENERGPLEDYHIEVSPGTYAISAAEGDSNPQTHLVCVKAGESVNLTFQL